MSFSDTRNRYPWTDDDLAFVATAKRDGARHKEIARELGRTPRAIDQQVARMKELGLLELHRHEEFDLLERVEAEAMLRERP